MSKRRSEGEPWGERKDMLPCEKESLVQIQAMEEEDMESGVACGEDGHHLQAPKFGGILRSQNLQGYLLRCLSVMCPSSRFSQLSIITFHISAFDSL